MSRQRHELRQLGQRYWQLWTATSLSSIGDGLVLIALPLLALSLTTNPLLISGVVVTQTLAASLGSIPAGVWADRYHKQKLTALVETIRMGLFALAALLVWTKTVDIAALYILALLAGVTDSIYTVAVTSATPQLVPPERRSTANGYLSFADTSSEQFIGQALGGLAYSLARAVPFLVDSISFALSAALSALALKDINPPQPTPPRQPGSHPFRQQLADGLRFFGHHRTLRTVAGSIATLAFAQAMALSLIVIYATKDLHLSHTGFGLFMAAAAIGNVIGSLTVGPVSSHWKPGTILLSAAIACAAGYALMATFPYTPLAVLGLWTEAVAVPIGTVSMLTLRQNIVPPPMLGRVNMSFRTAIYGAAALGGMLGGAIATALSVRASMATAACVIGVLILTVLIPLTRTLNTYTTPTPTPQPTHTP